MRIGNKWRRWVTKDGGMRCHTSTRPRHLFPIYHTIRSHSLRVTIFPRNSAKCANKYGAWRQKHQHHTTSAQTCCCWITQKGRWHAASALVLALCLYIYLYERACRDLIHTYIHYKLQDLIHIYIHYKRARACRDTDFIHTYMHYIHNIHTYIYLIYIFLYIYLIYMYMYI